MQKNNQKGFTLIEALLVVIAIAIITGVSYYIYSSNRDNSTSSVPTASQKTATKTSQSPKKDYLVINELGLKFDQSSVPGAYYKISASQSKQAFPKVPELKSILIYDKAYDKTKNSKGQACGSLEGGSEVLVVEVMTVQDRDKHYSQYKNADLGPMDDVPTVVSNKYAKQIGKYLYDYYKAQGVQVLIGCIDSRDNPQDRQVEAQFNSSYQKLREMVSTVQQS